MGISRICGFLKIRDTILGGPYEKRLSYFGVYVGSPHIGKLLCRIRSQNIILKHAAILEDCETVGTAANQKFGECIKLS